MNEANVGGELNAASAVRHDDASDELHAAIQARLAEITAPDYEDPAKRDFTRWDWIVFVGFLAACAIGFTIWGY
jgi:hypothetical protein